MTEAKRSELRKKLNDLGFGGSAVIIVEKDDPTLALLRESGAAR